MTKSMLQFQDFILEKIIQKVPHRHTVFCLPKILRSGFIRNREFLNDLSGIVWEATKEFMQRTLHVEGVPGGIQVIQTHGNLLNPNPHIHSITSDGLFTENGTFYCMPHCSEKAKDYLLKLFEKKVCDFVPEHKIAGEKNIRRILGQKHSGFSVFIDTGIDFTVYHPEEEKKPAQILRYMSKSFYSQEKIIYNEQANKVIYRSEFHKGVKRNFDLWQ